MNEFSPLDMSGYGAGGEDWNLGIGKMSIAYLAGARPDIVTQNGNYAKKNIDVRLYDLKGPFRLYAVWFDFANAKGGTTPSGTVIPTANGYAFGLHHQRLEWHGGLPPSSIQYSARPSRKFQHLD